MIDRYIDRQLHHWGLWANRRATDGLGYPSVSPMFQQVQHGRGTYRSQEPAGVCEYVHDTDAAVNRLPSEDQQLCVEFYRRGGSVVAIAARLGIARQRLYERLDAVHRAVMGHLNDIAAGY